MVVTEKRHMYETGTVNVETGNVAVKQDINYYNANVQSATRSIIRFTEDSDRRFSQNQIYDGATVSNGSSTVDVASGTLKIGGRWVSLSGTGISAAVGDDTYFVVAQVTGISETNSRDPSGGEAVTLTLVPSGSYSATDWKLVLGSAVISSSTVQSVQDRAKRQINATIIKPYGSATQVSIYTGDSPVYREAIRFTADKILPYNDIESAFDITIINITGTSLKITGQTNLADVSGSAISAISFAIGSQILDQSEFDNLVGLDQPLDTTQSPTFVQIISSITGSNAPLIVAGTGTVTNLSADSVRGRTVPVGATGNILLETTQQVVQVKDFYDSTVLFVDEATPTKKWGFQLSGLSVGTRRWTVPDRNDTFVGLTGTQTLTNKTLTDPIIVTPVLSMDSDGWTNAGHAHSGTSTGGRIHNDAISNDYVSLNWLEEYTQTGSVWVSGNFGYSYINSKQDVWIQFVGYIPKDGTGRFRTVQGDSAGGSGENTWDYRYTTVASEENADGDIKSGSYTVTRFTDARQYDLVTITGSVAVEKDDVISIAVQKKDLITGRTRVVWFEYTD